MPIRRPSPSARPRPRFVGFSPGTELFRETFIGKGAPAGTILVFGMQFAQGQVGGDGAVHLRKVSDNSEILTQCNVRTFWPDGSAKRVSMAIETFSLGAGATADLKYCAGFNTTPPAAINFATATTGRTVSVTVTPTSGTPWTQNLLASIPTPSWRSGGLVAEKRIEYAVPSTAVSGSPGARLIADIRITKAGDLIVDFRLTNDAFAFPDASAAVVNLTSCALTIDGTQVFSSAGTIAKVSSSSSRWFGRTSGGAAAVIEPYYRRPNLQQLFDSRLTGLYDASVGVNSQIATDAVATRASVGWNNWTSGSTAPLRDLIHGNPTGDNKNLYGIPFSDWSAAWLVSGNTVFYDLTIEQAEADNASGKQFFDRTNGRWLNALDRPGFRTWFTDANCVPVDSETYTFTPDSAHVPQVSIAAYVLSDRRHFLDRMIARLHDVALFPFATYTPGGYRAWASGKESQIRGVGYALNEFHAVTYCMPTDYPQVRSGWLALTLDENLQWALDERATLNARYGEYAGFFETVPGAFRATDIIGWQNNLVLSALLLMARAGNTKAGQIADWMKNYMINGWTKSNSCWPLSMTYYYLYTTEPDDTTIITTWSRLLSRQAELQAAYGTSAWTYAAGPDQLYVQYFRRTLAYYAAYAPNDATVQAACTAYDALTWSWALADARLQFSPKNHVTRPASYAVQESTRP